jgi:hypothetical protein
MQSQLQMQQGQWRVHLVLTRSWRLPWVVAAGSACKCSQTAAQGRAQGAHVRLQSVVSGAFQRLTDGCWYCSEVDAPIVLAVDFTDVVAVRSLQRSMGPEQQHALHRLGVSLWLIWATVTAPASTTSGAAVVVGLLCALHPACMVGAQPLFMQALSFTARVVCCAGC